MTEVTENIQPARPRTPAARRALVLGGGAVGLGLLVALLGIVLIGLGQFPAILLLPAGLALSLWGRSKLQQREPEFR